MPKHLVRNYFFLSPRRAAFTNLLPVFLIQRIRFAPYPTEFQTDDNGSKG